MPDSKQHLQKAHLFSLVLFVLTTLTAHAVTRATSSPTSAAEELLLSEANEDRLLHHLAALRRDPQLSQAALYHAFQMAEHADISHGFPGEPDLPQRGASAGLHFSLITENVAEAQDSSIIHNLWMHSSGHRANVLDPDVNVAGIAVVIRDNRVFAVEDFASTADVMSLEEQEFIVASLLKTAGLRVVEDSQGLAGARRSCEMTLTYSGMRPPSFVVHYTVARLDQLPAQVRSRVSGGFYHEAVIGACHTKTGTPFTSYNLAILLYP